MYFKQQLCCPIPDTARPCRGGASALPWRDRTVAAFNFPTTTAGTGCIKRKRDWDTSNGSQVRRGYGLLIGSPFRPPFGGAQDAAGESFFYSLATVWQSCNGGAQTAPGSAAAYSLTAQAAPASSIYSAPSGGAQQCGNPEGYRRPLHRKARRLPLIPNCYKGDNAMRRTSWQNLATSEAAGLCPEIAARGRADGATRPRPVTRPADARPRVCKTLKAQDHATLRRAALYHPATARGGQCGREDIRDKRGNARLWKSPTRSPGALPIRAISQ